MLHYGQTSQKPCVLMRVVLLKVLGAHRRRANVLIADCIS